MRTWQTHICTHMYLHNTQAQLPLPGWHRGHRHDHDLGLAALLPDGNLRAMGMTPKPTTPITLRGWVVAEAWCTPTQAQDPMDEVWALQASPGRHCISSAQPWGAVPEARGSTETAHGSPCHELTAALECPSSGAHRLEGRAGVCCLTGCLDVGAHY